MSNGGLYHPAGELQTERDMLQRYVSTSSRALLQPLSQRYALLPWDDKLAVRQNCEAVDFMQCGQSQVCHLGVSFVELNTVDARSHEL